MAHRNFVRMRHIISGAGFLGLTTILLAFTPGVKTALPLIFLVGMASILYMTATTALAQIEAKPEMRGRVPALQTVLMGGTRLIGGPILGWLADVFGGRVPIIFGGIVCLIAAVFGYFMSRRYIE